ncbi:MAG: hypothetical protein ACRD2S_07930 [Terriglobales bacterium]
MKKKYIAGSCVTAASGEVMIVSATDSRFFIRNEVATGLWQPADEILLISRHPLALAATGTNPL